jgi:LytS/YehU family sensor histidine kinase
MQGDKVLSEIYFHLGRTDSAYLYLNNYIQLKDSILNRQFLFRINNYKRALAEEKKQSQMMLLDKDNKLKTAQLKQQAQFKNFLMIGLVGLLFIGFSVFRWLTVKRKNEKLQNEKVQTELRHQATELEMQALRAQMNPHFIFNCLSSINRFILKNEGKTASNYLVRFSRLIRMVLINSQKSLVTLEDELQMLTLYLDMERLRFKDSFDYGITFLNTVETGNIFIPPLLLQPFCENAIWHGLQHLPDRQAAKEGHGRLDIEFSMKDNILNCTIADNGIGVERSEEMKSKSAEKEKSMGLKITTERLALLNREKGLNSFYDIESLKDEMGNVAGTKVTLKISFKEVVEETA